MIQKETGIDTQKQRETQRNRERQIDNEKDRIRQLPLLYMKDESLGQIEMNSLKNLQSTEGTHRERIK